jgi:hypothetical protein
VDDADLEAAVCFSLVYGVVELALNKRLPPQYWRDPARVVEKAPALAGEAVRPPRDADVPPVHRTPPRALRDDELDWLAAAGDGDVRAGYE